jgi:hypothetical protein
MVLQLVWDHVPVMYIFLLGLSHELAVGEGTDNKFSQSCKDPLSQG